jgi:hypothetical protein
MLVSLLLFGLLLGVRHALEADHVAAVAALASRSRSLVDHLKLAGVWGIGHAGALIVFGSVMLALDLSPPPALGRGLEALVGLVLIGLGLDVLRRTRRDRVHFHAHRHEDGTVHVHVHAHDPLAPAHDGPAHQHMHPRGSLPRALLVGGVHGLAGSAPLVLLSTPVGTSLPQTVAYLAVFGVGSILGMVLFSMSISLPLGWSARRPGRLMHGVQGALGTVTVAIGCWIIAGVLFGSTAG